MLSEIKCDCCTLYTRITTLMNKNELSPLFAITHTQIQRSHRVSAAHHSRSIKIAFSSLTLAVWLHATTSYAAPCQRDRVCVCVCVRKVYFDMIFNYVTSGHSPKHKKMNCERVCEMQNVRRCCFCCCCCYLTAISVRCLLARAP